METVLDEIKESITAEKTMVSIAAGITLSYLTSRLNTRNIVRVMPNTPALIQEGMSVMSTCGHCIPDKDIRIVKDIFISIGNLLVLPEKYMDAVTALSGSGPAFIALFIEAMVEGGINVGLNRDDALALAVQTAVGTSKLLDTGMSPSSLRKMVTSPGGTTAAGFKVFDERGFKDTVIAAIEAATNRATELGKEKI
jgi:pyrroline-5-carboxylate reductase